MRYLVFIVLMGLTWSCETEIDVVDESGSVPVVYCILNQDDTIHSLRLSRSYLTKNAQNPPVSIDSLVVKGKVNITIETVENSQVLSENRLLPYPISKDSGFFPSDLQWIYQANFKMKVNTLYRLIIEIKDWDYVAYSSIQSLGDFDLVDPGYPEARKIHLLDDHNPLIHWTRSQNAAVYQVGFRVHFKEIRGDQSQDKSIIILLTTAFYRNDPGAFYTYSINSNFFYKRLAESIPVDNTLLRQFINTDVFVIAGSESIGFYLNAQEKQDPFQFFDYKNLINGQGVFGSCKTKETKGFKIDDQSLDSLAYGSYTKQLNFLDSDGHRKN
ncbi:MAG: hypothetical protein WC865_11915 [Bacteroidales bacterium]